MKVESNQKLKLNRERSRVQKSRNIKNSQGWRNYKQGRWSRKEFSTSLNSYFHYPDPYVYEYWPDPRTQDVPSRKVFGVTCPTHGPNDTPPTEKGHSEPSTPETLTGNINSLDFLSEEQSICVGWLSVLWHL